MKFDHAVKHNGIKYPAGAEVPVGDSSVNPEKITRSDYEALKNSHTELMERFKEVEKIASDRAVEIESLKAENEQIKAENEQLSASIPPSGSQDNEHVETKTEYQKSDISRMNVASLRELATKLEIEDAENTSGEKLKEAIIEKLGL